MHKHTLCPKWLLWRLHPFVGSCHAIRFRKTNQTMFCRGHTYAQTGPHLLCPQQAAGSPVFILLTTQAALASPCSSASCTSYSRHWGGVWPPGGLHAMWSSSAADMETTSCWGGEGLAGGGKRRSQEVPLTASWWEWLWLITTKLCPILPLMGFDGVLEHHDAAGAKDPHGGWVPCFYLGYVDKADGQVICLAHFSQGSLDPCSASLLLYLPDAASFMPYAQSHIEEHDAPN